MQLQKILQLSAYPDRLVIGGGSNMLLTTDIDALVMHINLKGIQIVDETDDHVTIKVMAGENWHELVSWALEHDFGGLENLALIPGNVGTAPIQNIGAYGVELKDVFVSCEAMNTVNFELEEFPKEDCQFGYRDSIFKKAAKNTHIITSVKLLLSKRNHGLNTFYGAIEEELQKAEIVHPTIQNVAAAVIKIRQRKLPDPEKIGNSGSFFKNPVLSKKAFDNFHKKHPEAPFYGQENGDYKIPAGWLVEQCGFKGKRFGDAGVHEKQALVLVNHGNATGQEILDLALKIQEAVAEKFSIGIVPEVNIIK